MTVSILVPIYKVEKYIEQCARSLFEQTYKDIEYIFVDDCSPDESVRILQSVIKNYPDREKDVRIVRHEHNRGLAAARITALQECGGDFVVHVDSDDMLREDAVELMMEKQQETDADIVFSDYYIESKKGRETKERDVDEDKEKYLLDILGFKNLQHYVWGMMARTSLYKGHDIHPVESVNVGEDFQVLPQLIYYAKSMAKVDKPLYVYNRLNEDSYTYKFTEKVGRQDLSTFDILRNVFQTKGEKYTDVINRAEANYLYSRLVNYDNKMGMEFKEAMISRFRRLDSCSKRDIKALNRFLLQVNMQEVLRACISIKNKLRRILHVVGS